MKPGAKQGLLGCLGVLVLLAVIGAIVSPSPEDVGNRTGNVVLAEDTPAKAADDPKVAYSDAARSEFVGVLREILRLAQPCDQANTAAANALSALASGSGTIFEAYRPARAAQEACEASWLAIGRLRPPSSLPRARRDQAGEAIDACQMAYYLRKESLETMMEVLDGDQRPSVVENYREQAEGAQSGILACVSRLASVGISIGADIPGQN